MSTESRRNQILAVALKLAESDHYQSITREQIAFKADTATGTISRVFGSMVDLRDAIIERAVEEECLAVIGQGIAGSNWAALSAPKSLRKKALATLI